MLQVGWFLPILYFGVFIYALLSSFICLFVVLRSISICRLVLDTSEQKVNVASPQTVTLSNKTTSNISKQRSEGRRESPRAPRKITVIFQKHETLHFHHYSSHRRTKLLNSQSESTTTVSLGSFSFPSSSFLPPPSFFLPLFPPLRERKTHSGILAVWLLLQYPR